MNDDEDDTTTTTAGKLCSLSQTDPTFELFILSESGKPVYSYSRRDDVVTLMPVCQALLNFAHKSQRDTLHSITTSTQVRINFAIRSPLIIIVVGQVNSILDPLALITQIEAQIVSILTSKTLVSVFQQRPTFDLKRLLQGSDKLIDATTHLMISLLEFQQRRSLNLQLIDNELKSIKSNQDQLSVKSQDVSSISSQNCNNEFNSSSWPWIQAFLSSSRATNSNGSGGGGNGPTSRRVCGPELNRILVPVVMIPSNHRDQYTNMLSASQSPSMLFSLLFRVSRSTKFNNKKNPNSESSNNSNVNVIIDNLNTINLQSSDLSVSASTSTQQTVDNQDQNSLDPIENARILESENSKFNNDLQNEVNDMRFELVTICNHHPNAHKLHVVDMQLLLALLYGSRTQLVEMESLWMPVCLPRFNEDAFLHAHISLLLDQTYCLLIMSVDRDEFQKCQTIKTTCEEKLKLKMTQKFRDNYRPSSLLPPQLSSISISNSGNNNNNSNETTPTVLTQQHHLDSMKALKSDFIALRQLQFLWYQTQRRVLVWQQSPNWSMSRLIYYVSRRMSASHLKTMWLKSRSDKTILGWHVSTFQLYAQFDATITPTQALEAIQLVTNWIKKEEDTFTFKEYK